MVIESDCTYRVLASSWGVHVAAHGRAKISARPAGPERGEFRFQVDGECDPGVRKALALGVAETMPRVLRATGYANVDLTISAVTHTDIDFQVEGAAALAIRLLEKMFDLEESELDVTYDSESNRYMFPWDLSAIAQHWLDR